MAESTWGETLSIGESASFGESVQRRRAALGMTRAQLAQRVGCSLVTIKKIERDERRPSHQIAELLADHLLIPAGERSRFVSMARGELQVAPLGLDTKQEFALPAFLRATISSLRSDEFAFVAREHELEQLQRHLTQALRGQGQVIFVAGEAGCGKSLLSQEFARRSQQSHPDLVVATGHCNAYTGSGDPYLPFREILDLLTGDLEFHATVSKVHPDHALRLWQIMPATLRALVEQGGDLFNTFIPTRQLLNRLSAYLDAGIGELAPLHQLITTVAQREGRSANEGNAQQSALFEQYSRVLAAVARQRPLLLILDDLQWADAGSINLLFQLGRHLAGRRILILGIYRPADVALGRDGGRHPLQPVINELQRHFGMPPIELSQSEGRHFVDALIDAQPNRLSAPFREALFAQTGGHALFTVEMLRGLQEQGGMVQDDQGYWIEGMHLNWSNLPARVEGIIKERLARLSPSLRESLKIASVEGEIFTAEIVAAIQGIHVRALIGQLSHVLDKEQDLIRVVGVRRLDNGQTLSQYRFRHILFQRFLYDMLDEVERVYLHEAVGREMEQLYAGEADSVALPLARHFMMAGDDAGAMAYFAVAGDVAAAAYANVEAIAHYQRAIEIARRSSVASSTATHLYTRLGRVFELSSQFEDALAVYEELHDLARRRGDKTMALSATAAQSTIYITMTTHYDPERGQTLLEEALDLARSVNDRQAEVNILSKLTTLHLYAGHTRQAIAYGEQALALAQELDLREVAAFTLNDLGLSYFSVYDLQQAKVVLQQASVLWRDLGNRPMLADCLSHTCTVYLYAGHFEEAIAFSQEAYEISQSASNLWGQAYSRNLVGNAFWELGKPDSAIEMMEESIRLAELANFPVPHVMTRANLAVVLGELGAVERGLPLAHAALEVAERLVPVFRFHALTSLAQLYLLQGDLSTAEMYLQRAKSDELGKPLIFYLLTLLFDVELALRSGDLDRANHVLDQVLHDLRHFGIRFFLAKALHLQAKTLLAQGQDEAARTVLQEARAEAASIGSRVALWPILMSLSELETNPAVAEALRGEAHAIIESIAAHIPTPELRASYLALPHVGKVFEPIAT
jgi:tetratricopeptide (TPR) repeat protein/transcriptional regulator with XRE-family HTH domain